MPTPSSRLRLGLFLLMVGLLPALVAAQDRTKQKSENSQPTWLGVMLDKGGVADLDGEDPGGVPLRFVIEDGPAAEAGLRARDRILSVNGTPLHSSRELLEALRREAPGNWVSMTVSRGGEERDVRIKLDERPTSREGMRLRRGTLGIKTIELTPGLRDVFGAPAEAGSMVSEIASGSPAEAAGIELGDVIFEIDGETAANTKVLRRMIESGGVGNKIELTLARWGSEILVEAVLDAREPSGN